jgi:ABC-type branched-subunit amino acid transport system substrate-binding protein
MAQYVLRKLSVPQIGYSASSPKLSDSSIFPFFLRTAPSDTLQVVALIELIRHYGWNKVSTISADDAYSNGGVRAFEEHARARKMIISTSLEFAVEQQNVSKQVREVVRAGTRIVAVFAPASNMAAVVKEFGRYSDWGPQQGVTFVFSETLKVKLGRRRGGGGRGMRRRKRGGGGGGG